MKKWLLVSFLISVSFPLCGMGDIGQLSSMDEDTVDSHDGPIIEWSTILPDSSSLKSVVRTVFNSVKRVLVYPVEVPPSATNQADAPVVTPVQISAVSDLSNQERPGTSPSVPQDTDDKVTQLVTPVQPTPSPAPTSDNNQLPDSSDQPAAQQSATPSTDISQDTSSSHSFKSYMMDFMWYRHGFFGKAGLLSSGLALMAGAVYLLTRKAKAEKQMLIIKRMSTEVLIAIEQLDGPDPQGLNEQCDSLLNTLIALSVQLTYVSESTRDNLRGSIAQLVEAIREQSNAQDAYHALIAALCTCEQEIKIKGEEEAEKNPSIATRFLRWIKECFSSSKKAEAAQV